jgi:hypothetical protein
MAVVVMRYERGAHNGPPFVCESKSLPEGGEFRVGGKLIPPTKRVQLLVNGPDGEPLAIAADDVVLRRLFSRDAHHQLTLDVLLQFWDDRVKRALARTGQGREPQPRPPVAGQRSH